MTEKKKEFNDEELHLIEVVHDEYIVRQTLQEPDHDIKKAIKQIWAHCGVKKEPTVVVCDSPIHCKIQAKHDGFPSLTEYWSIWYVGYNAMYDFGNRIGLEIDIKKFLMFSDWVRCCPFVLFDEHRVYVSRKPNKLEFNDNQQLSCETGKSCEFPDKWGVYTINGVAVDEQIVMRPETQTIEQILTEQNEETKRIRIARYGWSKFLKGINARPIDERINDIEFTKEFLLDARSPVGENNHIRALMCICPSTGKEFILEIPNTINTCIEAQMWLSNGIAKRIISAS